LSRTVIVMCALYFDVYLHVQSVPITTKVNATLCDKVCQ
jgi:hypothetical protein